MYSESGRAVHMVAVMWVVCGLVLLALVVDPSRPYAVCLVTDKHRGGP